MKRFKNTFGVTGSVKQLEAFAEWAEGIGWMPDLVSGTKLSETYPDLLFSGADMIEGDSPKMFHYQSDGDIRVATYSLPSQWAEAMAAASEVEETVFEVGKKYIDSLGTIVLCTNTEPRQFSGVCVRPSNEMMKHKPVYDIGFYSSVWQKLVFTPYNETVTI